MKRLSWPLGISAALLYLFLYAPIGVVIVYSFNAAKHGGPWTGFSTEWYRTLFNSPDKLNAAWNTVVLAVASTAASTFLGTLLGFQDECAAPVQIHLSDGRTPVLVAEVGVGLEDVCVGVSLTSARVWRWDT